MTVIEAAKLLRAGKVIVNDEFGLRYYLDEYGCFRREGTTEESRGYSYLTTNDILFYEDELVSNSFEIEGYDIIRHADVVEDCCGNKYIAYMFAYPKYNEFKILDLYNPSEPVKVIATIIKSADYFNIKDITHGSDNRPLKLYKVLDDERVSE